MCVKEWDGTDVNQKVPVKKKECDFEISCMTGLQSKHTCLKVPNTLSSKCFHHKK